MTAIDGASAGTNRTANARDTAARSAAALNELNGRIQGDVRTDRLHRALYSTDASIYQMTPSGVVLPRSVDDVTEAVRSCARHGAPITARGAGTGLAGGAVNIGVQLDCSRYLNRIVAIDTARRTAVVESGVVLDELNAALAPSGLHFAPDVATSSRATLGGMIANNSCGAHSVLVGRTVDHVRALEAVLSDSSIARWGDSAALQEFERTRGPNQRSDLVGRIECEMTAVAGEFAADISDRYPKVMRRNGGYALDRVRTNDGRVNVETILCGSEGTLAIVTAAVLRLTPLPACRGLVIAHFAELLNALAATPTCLEHQPAAVELIDKLILDAARESVHGRTRDSVIEGDPHGILIIEIYEESAARLDERLKAVADDLRIRGMGYAWRVVTDPSQQSTVWNLRKAGLGLLMSRPGERQPYDFVDDCAVDPLRLRDFIARFMDVLREEGVEDCSYYAHASVGCLHVKPVLNLRRLSDVRRMVRVADRISLLTLEFGGAFTGEHGDGLVRSCYLEKMFGPRLVGAFARVKAVFDPTNIFNPGKIISPLGMADNLRWQPVDDGNAANQQSSHQAAHQLTELTVLDFSAHGGMAGMAEMCSGVGQCRSRLVGVMCPSYMATGDERDSTRGRANALRLALSDQGLLNGLDDPALDEVMDLCLSCKACKTECPTGVDMAKMKAEWLCRRNERVGVSWRSRLVAAMPTMAGVLSRAPRISNAMMQSPLTRAMMERIFGLDRRIAPPMLATETFRAWWQRRQRLGTTGSTVAPGENTIVYFVDTWTNYYAPQVGIAAVRVLETLGCQVIIADNVCCGRPAISKGLLHEAARLAAQNIQRLAPFAEAGATIVGTEPSCILSFVDEVPQMVRSTDARLVAGRAMMIESFLARRADDLQSLAAVASKRVDRKTTDVLYHAHCHQKAACGSSDGMDVLRAVCNAREIPSGCCGMAGSFGHEAEHYDVARVVGEQRLFPAVRARGDADVAVSGFSCLEQIGHHTGHRPRHVMEIVSDALGITRST